MKLSRFNSLAVIFVGVVAALILMLSGSALMPAVRAAPQGNTYVVTRTDDPTGSGSIGNLSLRQAVIYANSDPGSTIRLSHGVTYTLSIPPSGNDDATTGDLNITADTTFDFGGTICIPGLGVCPATIRGGTGWGDRLIYIAPNAHVSAYLLNLRGGNTSSPLGGGAVYVDGGAVLTLTNSTIANNAATGGAGLATFEGNVYLSNVQIISNTIIGNDPVGAGIWNSGGLVSITDSSISGNQGGYNGGGIANDLYGTVSLSNTLVSLNTSKENGAGLYIESGSVTINNSEIVTNNTNVLYSSGTNGAALAAMPAGDTVNITLNKVKISNNSAGGSGGGLFVRPDFTLHGQAFVTITDSSLISNTAEFGGAAEFNLCGLCEGSLLVSGTQVLSNTATGSTSGGLSLSGGGGSMTIVNSAIGYNRVLGTSFSTGGGLATNGNLTVANTHIFSNTSNEAGGGLYSSSGTISISDSSIDHNTTGGKSNDLNTGGGGLYIYGTFTLNNSTITANRALGGNGGGLVIKSAATLNNSSITANSAMTSTGGLENAGNLTLNNVTVSGNTAQYVGGVENRGTLVLNSAAISGNTTTIGIAGLFNVGTLTANHTSIDNNQDATGYGGGFQNRGTAQLANTQIVNNSTPLGWGAGIMNDVIPSQLTLDHVTVMSNTAQAASGIYNNEGTLTMTASTIVHNVATAGPGGGILNATYPSIPGQLYGSLLMDGSTVFDNSATDNGGGIYNSHVISITNSTLSGNHAANDGGGLYSDAGYDPTPMAYLDNVTIANNTADSDNSGVGEGGGVAIVSGTVSIRNALIGTNIDLTGQAPDCSGILTTDRYNLIQNVAGCTITGNTIGNITGQNPLLGPLQNNGGATWTQALLAGSPAIDKGNPSTPGSGLAACLATDQRGVTRPVGAACDIGAYEYGGLAYHVTLPLVIR